MKLSQLAALVYAALYFVLASAMEGENFRQSYPLVYVGYSTISQILVVGGVVLFALNAAASYAALWRWVFPLLVLDLVVGLGFDATIPADALSPQWFGSVLLSLWWVAPAYFLNFRVAYGPVPEKR
jgi:hypothetical protein